jgi:hypothetical protein
MLGICQRGFFKGRLFDVDRGREGAWLHFGCEHITGLKWEDFDFDFEHVADVLIEHRHLGIWIPDEVLVKVIERAPAEDDWLMRSIRFVIDNQIRPEQNLQELNEMFKNKYNK